ncbi:MAG TPA: GyrI-like domain-containing protein [Pantanalinema sp.]
MKLVQKAPIKVVGVEVVADWDHLSRAMLTAWDAFLSRRGEIKNRVGEALMDISFKQEGTQFTQVICSEVSTVETLPEGMVTLDIPAQWYVHHRHVGPVKAIPATFNEMIDWAESNVHVTDGFKLDIGYTARGQRAHDLYLRVLR